MKRKTHRELEQMGYDYVKNEKPFCEYGMDDVRYDRRCQKHYRESKNFRDGMGRAIDEQRDEYEAAQKK